MNALLTAVGVWCVAVMAALALLSGVSGAAETVGWLAEHVGTAPLYIALGVFIGVVGTTAVHRARQAAGGPA